MVSRLTVSPYQGLQLVLTHGVVALENGHGPVAACGHDPEVVMACVPGEATSQGRSPNFPRAVLVTECR